MSSCVLFGGTFDPPHLGHQMIIEKIEQLKLGEIIIIPNKLPYYKSEIITSDIDRLNMVKLMFKKYKIDTYELESENYTPTYETVKRYIDKYDVIYFVLGSDSYATIKSWHNYQYLAKNCNFIVINRGDNIKQKNAGDIILDNKIMDISSTQIRKELSEKYLTKEVFHYIKERNLYAKKNS